MSDTCKAQIYKWAILGCLASTAFIASYAAYHAQRTGDSSWYWLLVLTLFNSPSEVTKLAIKAIDEASK